MPYDSFGNFTRAYNWTADKLNGIKIESERMDGEFDNYATGMNQVLLRSGVTPLQGDLKMGGFKVTGLGAGSDGSPSVQFLADPTTGMFLAAPANIGFSANGVERFRVFSAGASVSGNLAVSGTISGNLTPLSVTGSEIADDTLDSSKWSPNAAYAARNGAFALYKNTLNIVDARWTISNGNLEAGGNSGNDLIFRNYSDTGVQIGTPVIVKRSDGAVTIAGNLNVGGIITGDLANLSVTGNDIADDTLDSSKWKPNANFSARNAGFALYKNALVQADTRWLISNGNVEGGGNTGNDLIFRNFSDVGVQIGTPLIVKRGTGLVQVANGLEVNDFAFDRRGTAANGYNSNYYIGGVVRWRWAVEGNAGGNPNGLTLVAHNAAGASAEQIVSYHLTNFTASFGNATEVRFLKSTSGAGFSGISAARFLGTNPAILFQSNGDGNIIGFGQRSGGREFAMTKADGTAAVFIFNNDNGIGLATTWTSTSDVRLKYDIAPVATGLDTLAALTPYTYMQSVSEAEALSGVGVFNAGILAQDLIGTPLEGLVLPPSPDPDTGEGYYAFNYTGLTAWYIAAFKEIKTRLDDIEARLDAAGL